MTTKKNISTLILSFAFISVLSGCGESEVKNIAITYPTDSVMDCSSIAKEFSDNERQVLTTIKERNQEIGNGVAAGIGGVFIIPNSVFTGEESPRLRRLNALRNRNDILQQMARTKKCPAIKSGLTEFYKKIDANKVQ